MVSWHSKDSKVILIFDKYSFFVVVLEERTHNLQVYFMFSPKLLPFTSIKKATIYPIKSEFSLKGTP